MQSSAVMILMASYNGIDFIARQIQSIIDQTYKDWVLFIQDDGSTDGTVEIIERYCEKDDRIHFLKNKGRHGPYYNFHSLINKAKKMDRYPFYMFSDHDDIWCENKVETFVDYYLARYEADSDIPVCLYGDMNIIDENDYAVDPSVNALLGMRYRNKWSTLFSHNVFGCNMFINEALFLTAPCVDTENRICDILCHDNYYAKFAAFTGDLIFIDKILMHYRRYGKNVTAEQDYHNNIKKILNRLRDIKKLEKSHARTYRQSLYTIRLLKETCECTFDETEKIIRDGGFKSVAYFKKYDIECGSKIKTMSHLFILILKGYKEYINFES